MPRSICSVGSIYWQPSYGLPMLLRRGAEELQRVISLIRTQWQTRILVRGDSAYSREDIMVCESQGTIMSLVWQGNARLMRMRVSTPSKVECHQLKESVTGIVLCGIRLVEPLSAGVAKVVYGPEGFQPASSLPPSQHGGFLPVSSTLSITVPGARWRTASRSSNSNCSALALSTHTFQGNQLQVVVFSIAYADECSAAELSSYDRASFKCGKPSAPSYSNRRTGTHQCSAHSDCYQHWLSFQTVLLLPIGNCKLT